MTIMERNCFIYKKAIEYLWEHSQGLTQEILDTYLLWLIGSGNFYNHKGIVSFNGNKSEFVEMVKSELDNMN